MSDDSTRTNKKRVCENTDKHICKFLLSSFRGTGIHAYKKHFGLSFPDPPRNIYNRISYLKSIQQSNFPKFAKITQSYGVTSGDASATDIDSSSSDSDSTDTDDEDSFLDSYFATPPVVPSRPIAKRTQHPPKQVPKSIPKPVTKPFLPTMASSINKSDRDGQGFLRQHKHFLNFEYPHLNHNGMMWFKDDDVEVDNLFLSIITIYQPLFDARDIDDIKLYLDPDEPNVLHHVQPNVPSFMYKDVDSIMKLDSSKANPELHYFTHKKLKKSAHHVQRMEEHRLQRSDYRLEFNLSLAKFDDIDNSGSELQKHYRTFEVEIDADNDIHHICAYVFWKVLVDGETTDFSSKDLKQQNHHLLAAERMSNAFGNIKIEK